MLRGAIEKITRGEDLEREEARQAALAMLGGDVPDSVIGGLLVGLRAKGETEAEITGFAQGMREVRVSITPAATTLVDTCGTGGDRSGTFNISTTAALIAAAAGVKVAKHGNRGVSSRCGSADVLEALGVDIEMPPAAVKECIETIGFGFMFAPAFHPAMKRVMGPRKDLGVPTIFNILGPLTNPAGARAQVLGVNSAELAPLMGRVLCALGCERAYVLHGMDGLDEFSLSSETIVCELDHGVIVEYLLEPEDLGFARRRSVALKGGDADRNAAITRSVLAGEEGPALEACTANAAFAVVAGGVASSLREGVETARSAVESGAAATVLQRLASFSKSGGNGGGADVSR
jgi:anthranilate phosphoribosyltransferase